MTPIYLTDYQMPSNKEDHAYLADAYTINRMLMPLEISKNTVFPKGMRIYPVYQIIHDNNYFMEYAISHYDIIIAPYSEHKTILSQNILFYKYNLSIYAIDRNTISIPRYTHLGRKTRHLSKTKEDRLKLYYIKFDESYIIENTGCSIVGFLY